MSLVSLLESHFLLLSQILHYLPIDSAVRIIVVLVIIGEVLLLDQFFYRVVIRRNQAAPIHHEVAPVFVFVNLAATITSGSRPIKIRTVDDHVCFGAPASRCWLVSESFGLTLHGLHPGHLYEPVLEYWGLEALSFGFLMILFCLGTYDAEMVDKFLLWLEAVSS